MSPSCTDLRFLFSDEANGYFKEPDILEAFWIFFPIVKDIAVALK